MNRKFLSKLMLGTIVGSMLNLGNISAEQSAVVFPENIEKIVKKYENKNKRTFLKDLIWFLPFTNPYGPNEKARKELGDYYQLAIPRIYSDPVYNYTKRSEQLTYIAQSVDDEEMRKLNDSIKLFNLVKSGEEWMKANGKTRVELGRLYGGSNKNIQSGKPFTEIVEDWNSILARPIYDRSLNEMRRLEGYNNKWVAVDNLKELVSKNLQKADLPESVKVALTNGSSESLMKIIKNARDTFSVGMSESALTNFAAKFLTDSRIGRDIVWVGGASVAALSNGVLKTLGEKAGNGIDSAKKFCKKVFSKSMDAKNYKELLKQLKGRLKAKVVGQDEAIEKIISILESHFSNVVKAKELGIPYTKGCLIIFGGTPGVGKTLVMEEIEDFLNLTSASFGIDGAVEDKGNNAMNVMARFLKPVIKDDGKKKTEIETDLSRIVSYENTTLYKIDEKDKMDALDFSLQKTEPLNADGKRKGSSIDEFLRQFVDYDTLNGHTTNNSIVIVSTNERMADMLKYEESLTNRYMPCFVEFKPFNKDACIEMAKRNLQKPCGEYYSKRGISVAWDKKGLERYGQKLSEEFTNGRTISQLAKSWTVIVDKFVERYPQCKNITLDYTEKGGVFAKEEKVRDINANTNESNLPAKEVKKGKNNGTVKSDVFAKEKKVKNVNANINEKRVAC